MKTLYKLQMLTAVACVHTVLQVATCNPVYKPITIRVKVPTLKLVDSGSGQECRPGDLSQFLIQGLKEGTLKCPDDLTKYVCRDITTRIDINLVTNRQDTEFVSALFELWGVDAASLDERSVTTLERAIKAAICYSLTEKRKQ